MPEYSALNGQIPIFTFSRLLQPLSLLYSINNTWLAYVLSDILVRTISFLGMYWLAKQQKLPAYIAVLLAICFTTSISYSVYLLSIAGLPLFTIIIICIFTSSTCFNASIFGVMCGCYFHW